MAETGGPLEPATRLSDELRTRGIDLLRGRVATGQVDLHTFEDAVDQLVKAQTESEFSSVVRRLAPPVEITPPERRLTEPLHIDTSMGAVRLGGRWQVPRQTEVRTSMGAVSIDLTEAEFDDWTVDLVVHSSMGAVEIIVPRGMAVQLVGRNGPVESQLDRAIPGFPLVRLTVTTDMGRITLRHPKKRRRRFLRSRREGRRALQP